MADADPITRLLAQLDGHKPAGEGKWMARCPAHEDRQASLSIARGDEGKALVNCHAGCETAAVLDAVGLTMADLFAGPPPHANGHHQQRQRVDQRQRPAAGGEGRTSTSGPRASCCMRR